MSGRYSETIVLTLFLGALESMLGALLYNLLSTFTGHQPTALLSVVGALVLLALIPLAIMLVWRHHTLRCRVLALSQSRRGHLALALLAVGLVIGTLASFQLFPASVSANMLQGVAYIGAIGLAMTVAVYAVLRLIDQPLVSAAHCHYVVKRIERERVAGVSPYTFLEGAPAGEIRRQCRILDYLMAQKEAEVVRRFYGYQIRGRVGIDLAHPSVTAALAPANGENGESRGLSAASALQSTQPDASVVEVRKREQRQYAEYVATIAKYANAVCEAGARTGFLKLGNNRPVEQTFMVKATGSHRVLHVGTRGRGFWRKTGSDTQRTAEDLYAKPFFGSKLDDLFNGGDGYRVGGPGGTRFTTMVVKGQPGAGKSTMALQLCVTLAKQGNVCLYYSLEEEREGLLESARDYGWDLPESIPNALPVDYRGVLHKDIHYGRQRLKSRIDELRATAQRASAADTNQQDRVVGTVLVSSLGHRAMAVKARMKELHREWSELPEALPRCVVIDSLEGFANAGLSVSGKPAILREEMLQVKDFFRDRCDMLVILVEDDGSGTPGYVDFVADSVIQLGRRDADGYIILYSEVLKARNQTHALGQHQMKIRSLRDMQRAVGAASDRVGGAHPGIIIFPSLDYILSQSRALSTFDEHTISSGFTGLDTLLGADRAGGLRRQSAIALLGPGSTGKSLIGMNFLIEGVRESRPALLLSLRDDEGIIKRRLVPQEPHRMRLSWISAPNDRWYHRIDWHVEGIAGWLDNLNEDRVCELPYLFPIESDALRAPLATFLGALSGACPPEGWTNAARQELTQVYESACARFAEAGGRVLAAAGYPDDLLRQRLTLNHVTIGADQPPTLTWDSRKRTPDGVVYDYDTHLLEVKSWRLGRIAPEDFVDWLLAVIGGPREANRFGRVVFDDVSQLSQRFPLLGASQLFLPTLIDLFKAKRIASLFLAGFDEGAAVQSNSGLDVMADHVIRTRVKYLIRPSLDHGPGASPTASDMPAPAVLKDKGDYTRRITVVDIDARPGSDKQPPHQLVVRASTEGAPTAEIAKI